jgi:hypothetical protein
MSGLETGVSVRDFRKRDLRDVLEIANLSFVREFKITGFDPEHVKKWSTLCSEFLPQLS